MDHRKRNRYYYWIYLQYFMSEQKQHKFITVFCKICAAYKYIFYYGVYYQTYQSTGYGQRRRRASRSAI